MRAPFRAALYIIYYALPILTVAKSLLQLEDQFNLLHLSIICMWKYSLIYIRDVNDYFLLGSLSRFSSNEGKEALIKTKFTTLFQKYELKVDLKYLSYIFYAWLFGRFISEIIDLVMKRTSPCLELNSAMQMLLTVLLGIIFEYYFMLSNVIFYWSHIY